VKTTYDSINHTRIPTGVLRDRACRAYHLQREIVSNTVFWPTNSQCKKRPPHSWRYGLLARKSTV